MSHVKLKAKLLQASPQEERESANPTSCDTRGPEMTFSPEAHSKMLDTSQLFIMSLFFFFIYIICSIRRATFLNNLIPIQF